MTWPDLTRELALPNLTWCGPTRPDLNLADFARPSMTWPGRLDLSWPALIRPDPTRPDPTWPDLTSPDPILPYRQEKRGRWRSASAPVSAWATPTASGVSTSPTWYGPTGSRWGRSCDATFITRFVCDAALTKNSGLLKVCWFYDQSRSHTVAFQISVLWRW